MCFVADSMPVPYRCTIMHTHPLAVQNPSHNTNVNVVNQRRGSDAVMLRTSNGDATSRYMNMY